MNNEIPKDTLLNLIEPHLREGIIKDSYVVKDIPALSLLTPNRFDIAFKLFYLRFRLINEKLANHLYSVHLNVSTGGTFSEFGNKSKVGLDKFKSEFSKIMKSMEEGFDSNRSILPLCSNHAIANGAHRIAAGIFLKKQVAAVELAVDSIVQDHNFFRNNGVDKKSMDLAALEYSRYAENIYLAVLWPAMKSSQSAMLKKIPDIIYSKDVKFSPAGAINLVALLYNREKWLGDASENYPGAAMKVGECFPTYNLPVKFVLFRSKSENLSEIKESVRAEFNLGKSSIHITDTTDETRVISNSIFNDNSIHFLNYSNQKWNPDLISSLDNFEKELNKLGLNKCDLVIDGGAVMQSYGLREAEDIDVMCINAIKDQIDGMPNVDSRSFDIIYHGEDINDLIYDPDHYFYFHGFKFIALHQLNAMKERRNEEKDIIDIKLISPLLANQKLFSKLDFRSLIFIRINKYKVKIVKILNSIGIYKYIQPVYKWLVRLVK